VVLTTAVFAVILSAPAGAILVNSLGTKLLTYDGAPGDEGAEDAEAAPEGSNKVAPAKPEVSANEQRKQLTETCEDAEGNSELEAEATGKVSIQKSHDYEKQPAPNSMPTRKFLTQMSTKFNKKPADVAQYVTILKDNWVLTVGGIR
jgi:hypothetical protein